MSAELRVNPEQLRAASTGWHMDVANLHAIPPSLEPPAPWPTTLAAPGVAGAAQAATPDLHAGLATTAEMTQVATTGYETTEADSASLLNNIVTTITGDSP